MATFEDIKELILERYPTFHNGYINVSIPEGKQVVINEDANTYVGISDNLGNYFYIRDLKKADYSPGKQGARVQYYRKTQQCRIVSVYHNGDEDAILQALISCLTKKGALVSSSITERTTVYKNETGMLPSPPILEKLSLVSVDFELVSIVNANDCDNELCNC